MARGTRERSIAEKRETAAALAAAVGLYNGGRFAEALEAFRRLRAAGARAAARFEAHCLDSLGRVEQAIALLRALARRGSERGAARLALAEILQREGLPGLEAEYRRALGAFPWRSRARRRLREIQRRRAQERLIALGRRAIGLRERGRLREAAAVLARLPGSAQRTADLEAVRRLMALREESRGLWARAARRWRRLLRLRAHRAEARKHLIALSLRSLNGGNAAGPGGARAIKEALRLGRGGAEDILGVLERLRALAQESLDCGRHEAAASLLARLSRLGPEDSRARARARLTDLLEIRLRSLIGARRFISARRLCRRLYERTGEAGRSLVLLRGMTTGGRELLGTSAPALVGPPSTQRPAQATRLESIQLPIRWAETELQSGGQARALSLWSRALALLEEPRSLDERVERFKLLIALKDYAGAFSEAERALAQGALSDSQALAAFRSPWAVTARRPLRGSGVFAKDHQDLERLSREKAWGPWPFYYRALLAERCGGGANRDECFERAQELASERHAWMGLEVSLRRLHGRNFTGALEAALSCARILPESLGWYGLCYAAEARLCLGRHAEGLSLFDRAIERTREFRRDAQAWKGEGLLWLGRYAEALEILDRAVDGGAPYAYCWRAAAGFKAGRPKAALDDLDRGLALYDRDLESYAWRGEILRALGEPKAAIAALNVERLREPFQGALSLPPSGPVDQAGIWAWHLCNRALARADLGEESGLRSDFDLLPLDLRRYCGGGVEAPGAPRPASELRRELEGLLELARGCRRPERYVDAIWSRSVS